MNDMLVPSAAGGVMLMLNDWEPPPIMLPEVALKTRLSGSAVREQFQPGAGLGPQSSTVTPAGGVTLISVIFDGFSKLYAALAIVKLIEALMSDALTHFGVKVEFIWPPRLAPLTEISPKTKAKSASARMPKISLLLILFLITATTIFFHEYPPDMGLFKFFF